MSVGDTVRTSAMLSKPWLMSSAGRRGETSTSTSRSSRMELAYSVRFSRCRGGPAGIGVSRCGLVDSVFDRRDEGMDGGGVRPWHPGRRHQADTQFTDHLLGQLGGLAGMLKIQFGQRHAAGLQLIVVTAGAILVYQACTTEGRKVRSHLCASRCRARKNEATDYYDALFQSFLSKTAD